MCDVDVEGRLTSASLILSSLEHGIDMCDNIWLSKS